MMQSPYRDSPANSVADVNNYYDDVRPTQSQSSNFDPYNTPQDIPLTDTSRNMAGDTTNIGYAALPAAQTRYNAGSEGYVYPVERNDRWMEKSSSGSRRAKWITVGVASLLIVLIAVGVSVGVVVSRSHKNLNSSSSHHDGSNSTSSGNGSVNQTNPNDPSTFQRDPRLKRSFYGFAYAPEGVQLPNCGATLSQVITDIQLLSQLTSRIRLYGADCNQSALVLEAIRITKVDMKVFLGNYPVPDDNNAAYNRQKAEIQSAIQTYGTDHIAGITVGNEFMLNYVTEHQSQDPNSAIGNAGAQILIADINDTRQMLAGMGLTGTIPVGNSDAGAYFNNMVLQAVDYGLSNVHPWFGGVSISDAAGWTWDFFNVNNVQPAAALSNNPAMYIAETGWPSTSSNASSISDGASLASEANLQIFLDTFICQANTNGTKYFFFEYFDETWKDAQFGGVEGHWGLFYSNRTLKGVTIPDCASP